MRTRIALVAEGRMGQVVLTATEASARAGALTWTSLTPGSGR